MKNEQLYDALGGINENYINEAHQTAKKKSQAGWIKWVAMAACLCFVVAGAFVLPTLQNDSIGPNSQLSTNPNIGTEHQNNDEIITQPNSDESITQPNNKNVLLVNAVDGVASADMDVQFSYYPDPSEDESDDVLIQFENVAGISYNNFVAKIPDIFVKERFYSVDVPTDATTAYIPHDFVFGYRTNNGGEITIAICAQEEPLRDLFVICDDPKQSEINGIPVVILGYQDSFLVEFSWQSVNYDIETRSVTLEELEQLLAGIIS